MPNRIHAAVALVFALASLPARANDEAKQSLIGVVLVRVVVAEYILAWDRNQLDHLQLQREIEQRLREAGVRVVDDPSAASLYVQVHAIHTPLIAPEETYAYTVIIELKQRVGLPRTSLMFSTPTWSAVSMGMISPRPQEYFEGAVRSTTQSLVGTFVTELREANSNR